MPNCLYVVVSESPQIFIALGITDTVHDKILLQTRLYIYIYIVFRLEHMTCGV